MIYLINIKKKQLRLPDKIEIKNDKL